MRMGFPSKIDEFARLAVARQCLSRWWRRSLVAVVFIAGCAPGLNTGSQSPGPTSDEALLSIYLETRGDCAGELSLEFDDLVLRSDLMEVPLFLEPVSVARSQAKGRQTFLGLAQVPAGYYSELDLFVEQPDVSGEVTGQIVTLRFPKRVYLEAGDSQCLFITWHQEDCTGSDEPLAPKLSAIGQSQPLFGDLLYALSSDINTLYLVRTDTQFVTAAIGLDGGVGEMAVDPRRRLLYMVNRLRRSLQVLDLATHSLVDRIPLPLTLEPAHLALDVAGNRAFVSDPLSRLVVQIDLESGQMIAHQQVGLQPGRLVYIEQEEGVNLVAVCLPRTQQVVLMDADTLQVQLKLETGLQPKHLLFADEQLYVAAAGSRTVTLYSLPNGRQVGQVRVSGLPGELLVSSTADKIYVSLTQPASLAVLGMGQFATLSSLSVGVDPGVLELSERRGRVFVANRASRTITVLDRASEQQIARVPLGGTVVDLAVFE